MTVYIRQDLGVQPFMPAPIPRMDLQPPARPGSPSDSGEYSLVPKLHGGMYPADFGEVTVPESHTLGVRPDGHSSTELTASFFFFFSELTAS